MLGAWVLGVGEVGWVEREMLGECEGAGLARCPEKVNPMGAACCIPIGFAIAGTAPWVPHAAFP